MKGAALLGFLTLVGACTTADSEARPSFNSLSDQELFRQIAQNSAFNEYRCRGLSADETESIIEDRFSVRIDRLEVAMIATHGPQSVELPEHIMIGRRCPHYRGAIERLETDLDALENRLGLK